MSLGHADLLTRVKNTLLRASKIVQQVKALAATPESLDWDSQDQHGGKRGLLQVVHSHHGSLKHVHMHAYTHT